VSGGGLRENLKAMEDPKNWDIKITDPQDYIGDTVTATIQAAGGKYVVMSITIDYKKPTATNYALGVHLADERKASRIFWFNEGVEILDSWAYPSVKAAYEQPLDIPRVCNSEEDPSDRITCTFASMILSEKEKAQLVFDKLTSQKVVNNFETWVAQHAGQDFEDTWNELKQCNENANLNSRESCAFADRIQFEIERARLAFDDITVNQEIINNFE
jgi:hypothetical protein